MGVEEVEPAILDFVNVMIRVYDSTVDASLAYRTFVESMTTRAAGSVEVDEAIEGWWDDGTSVQSIRARGGTADGVDGSVLYTVYHGDLVLGLTITELGLDDAGPVSTFHEVALAVLDEAKVHLPCRSLVYPPVAGCD